MQTRSTRIKVSPGCSELQVKPQNIYSTKRAFKTRKNVPLLSLKSRKTTNYVPAFRGKWWSLRKSNVKLVMVNMAIAGLCANSIFKEPMKQSNKANIVAAQSKFLLQHLTHQKLCKNFYFWVKNTLIILGKMPWVQSLLLFLANLRLTNNHEKRII